MKKLVLVSSIIAAATFAQLSQAKTGDINFTGELIAASCSVSGGGAGGGPNSINVPMGKVSIDDLGDGSAGDFGAETAVNLDIDCASGAGGLTSVIMNFAPRSGSGLDADDTRLLQLTSGGAAGVGIALINDTNTIIDLGSAETVKAALTAGSNPGEATAKLNLRAAYIKTTTPTAGVANATMPFTLSYE